MQASQTLFASPRSHQTRTVVDIGCGAGMDLMLAASADGPGGQAIDIGSGIGSFGLLERGVTRAVAVDPIVGQNVVACQEPERLGRADVVWLFQADFVSLRPNCLLQHLSRSTAWCAAIHRLKHFWTRRSAMRKYVLHSLTRAIGRDLDSPFLN